MIKAIYSFCKTKKKLLITAIIAALLVSLAFFWSNTKILYHAENDYGPVLVYDQNDIRCLSFVQPPSDVVQSCMSISRPKVAFFTYTHMLLSSLFIQDHPRKILMIGLGGATIPKALNILTPRSELDIVEINPEISFIATKYFNFSLNDQNHIIIADGFNYVKESPADTYDIVIIDAFSLDYIPESLLTDEFMQNIKKVLTKNGVVAINTFEDSKFRELESELFKNNFGEYYNLTANGNRIIIASKSGLPDISEVMLKSNLWLYRFLEVGINQVAIASLFKKP